MKLKRIAVYVSSLGVLLLVAFAVRAQGSPVEPHWSAAATMNLARMAPGVALLENGKVLVVGGHGAGYVYLKGAELYDPANDTWSQAGTMSVGRHLPLAVRLADGRVLIAGGFDRCESPCLGSAALASAELYDPATNSWQAASAMAEPRGSGATARLANGKVLVVGGYGPGSTYLASAELYDPASSRWTSAGAMKDIRLESTATLLGNGKVLVTGGFDGGQNLWASAELYDPATNTWSTTAAMKVARRSHAATLLANGKVLVTGGATAGDLPSAAELYDPHGDVWTDAAAMNHGRFFHTATLLPSGHVLVIGGTAGSLAGVEQIATNAELYDPQLNSWVGAGELNAPPVLSRGGAASKR